MHNHVTSVRTNFYRSRPESYISVESDVVSVMGSNSGLNNSTPINEVILDTEDNDSSGDRSDLVVAIGEITEDTDKDIVESSDC